jgi:hypothetical protein
MAPEGRMGEMKCIFDMEKYFYMGQGFSGERCDPWAFCLFVFFVGHVLSISHHYLLVMVLYVLLNTSIYKFFVTFLARIS